MRFRVLAVLILGCVTAFGMSSVHGGEDDGAPAPSVDDVLKALTSDERSSVLRKRFHAWGDKAVPHLRTLLGGADGGEHLLSILRALAYCGTRSAAEVYVDLLRSPLTGGITLHAVNDLYVTGSPVRGTRFRKHLVGNKRFKPSVVSYFDGPLRGTAAELAAHCGWMDQVRTLDKLLTDRDYDVRRKAADAIHRLTGKRVEVEKPQRAFPATSVREGVFGRPVRLPKRGPHGPDFVRFVRWFDGAPRFLYGWPKDDPVFGHPRELRVTTGDPATHVPFPLPPGIEDLCMLHAGGMRLLVGNGRDPKRGLIARRARCFDADGKERWTWRPQDSGPKSMAPLVDAEGVFGVALGAGGDDGIVGLDLEGRPLWDVPRTYVTYAVHTHAALPGWLLHVGGSYELYRHTRKSVELAYTSDRGKLATYAAHGLLLPDERGAPTVILAGESMRTSTPSLQRIDAKGQRLWQAVLASEVEALALIEPKGLPPLLVVTTEGGRILIVGADGTLLADAALPEGHVMDDGRIATLALDAGPLDGKRHAAAVRLIGAAYLIPLDLRPLTATKPEKKK
ncbi:MAG: hypothetical protein QNJ90_14505 [Planctomycetota bacterium]|nr:hypothetical protein [Planctomycetota bacterium]